MNKEKEVDVRLEDLGKQLLASAEPIEMDVVEAEILKYIEKHRKSRVFLLFGKEIGYHQVFIGRSIIGQKVDTSDFSIHIREFLDESSFFDAEGTQVNMTDVRFIQDEEEVQGLSLWLGTTYFQLLPFDFGVEYVLPGGLHSESIHD